MVRNDRIDFEPDQEMVYQIRLVGHLGQEWATWFGSATIQLEENGESVIICHVTDQPALFGLLRKVRDLDMPLVSIERLYPRRPGE